MGRLATWAPVQHPVGFAVVGNPNQVATAVACFALSAICRQLVYDTLGSLVSGVNIIRLQHFMCQLHKLSAFGALQRSNLCPWMNLASP